jgi:hypothetical protein
MIDREKLETILRRRFPGARRDEIAASANAIMGLDEEWEEIQCDDFAVLAAFASQVDEGEEVRVLKRRPR